MRHPICPQSPKLFCVNYCIARQKFSSYLDEYKYFTNTKVLCAEVDIRDGKEELKSLCSMSWKTSTT